MADLEQLMQQLRERTQGNYEAQQPSPIMSALGKLSGALQVVDQQQKEHEQRALENAYKKAATAKVNAEIDVVKEKTKPIKPEQSMFVQALFKSYGQEAPPITTQGEMDDAIALIKTVDVHAQRKNQLDLQERKFEEQKQQFQEKMTLSRESAESAKNFRAQLMTERDPEVRSTLNQIANYDDEIANLTAKSPLVAGPMGMDVSLQNLQSQRDQALFKLQELRDRKSGGSGLPEKKKESGGKPVKATKASVIAKFKKG